MPAIRVELRREAESYGIHIGIGLLAELSRFVKNINLRTCIITDTNTEKLFGQKVLGALKIEGIDAELISFRAGEASKNRETKEAIEDELIEKGFGRDTMIIALGGGVVGDLAGFVAATYNRGIAYIQVPTTLLAMADSSIGGKTGIDTKHGKNLIGAFWHPKAVYSDIDFLKTLPEKEISNGMAESIKHAMIADKALFEYLEKNMEKVLGKEKEALIETVTRCAAVKAEIVMKDEREGMLRKALNYGHTIGHAVEQLSGYKLSHGEAIAIGMAVEAKISEKLGLMNKNDVGRQNRLLQKAKLPVKVPGRIKTDDIIAKTQLDKKARRQKAEYVLLGGIGKVAGIRNVDEQTVRESIDSNR